MNAHAGDRILRSHETALEGKWSDAREDVAAIGRDVDPRLVDHDLPEQEIDVAALPSRSRDDRDLAGEG